MSTAPDATIEHHDDEVDPATHAAHGYDGSRHEHGMTDRQYVVVALVLAVLTAIEVSTYYLDFGPLFTPTLIVLMVLKFFIVASLFMHLRFDSKIFSWMFYAGLFLAIAVYVGALSTFKFFLA